MSVSFAQVTTSQVIQADTVTDMECLDWWLKFRHLWNVTEKLITGHALHPQTRRDHQTLTRRLCGIAVDSAVLLVLLLVVPSVLLSQ